MITARMLSALERSEWGGNAKNRPSYVDRMRAAQAARAEAKKAYDRLYRVAKKARIQAEALANGI